MCTVTWWRDAEADGYELFFNRDERRTRGSALPPGQGDCRGVPYLSPTDSDHRGTWLLVNAFGVSLGLVNHYPPAPAAAESPALSRGLLLRDLADVPSVAVLAERLAAAPLRRCAGFYLIALGRAEAARRWCWDTHTLREETELEPLPFLTSSSYHGAEIVAYRRNLFAQLWNAKNGVTPQELDQFHRQADPEQPARGVLMDRPDARTVSVSHLVVGPNNTAVFAYGVRSRKEGAMPGPPLVARLFLRQRR